MRKIGQLECLEVNHSLEDGVDYPWVVLFHGYGADAQDLFGLGDYLQSPEGKKFNFMCMNAPYSSAFGGRAWWSIDLERLQRTQMTGEFEDFADNVPPELTKVRTMVYEAFRKAEIDWKNLILGGFSQGAMLATELFFDAPEAPLGLMAFSGAVINKADWLAKGPKRSGAKVFQSHGNMDMVLTYEHGKQLAKVFHQCGLKGELSTFKGGHEIPLPIVARARTYIQSRFQK